MSTFSIDLPDELARKLEPLRKQLPDLLARIATSAETRTEAKSSAYKEVLDFLLRRPTSSEIIAFTVSLDCQNR
jgi:predicted transcriptional regulator